jgi:hypothetical protein
MAKQQKKEFDCIQIKRDAQSKIYETIKQMNPEQEIAYFHRSIQKSMFADWWKSVSTHSESPVMR